MFLPGLDVHSLAEPTKLEALQKEYTTKKDEFKDDAKNSILDKYGGKEHLEAPPRELIFAQTEDYVEYTRHGKVLKGEENPVVRSRYEEDVYLNNHTAIWGSYWNEGKWGFKCCHSFVKNSYCTGQAGKEAGSSMLSLPPPTSQSNAEDGEKKKKKKDKEKSSDEDEKEDEEDEEDEEARKERQSLMEAHQEKMRKKREKKKRKKEKKSKRKKSKKKKKKRSSSSSSSDDDSSSSDSDSEKGEKKKKKKSKKEEDFEAQVAKAMKKQEETDKRAEELLKTDERKRKYNSMQGGIEDTKQVTEAEMEAYYRKRQREDDPMAQFMSKKK